jgi:4'-phosphopantetheinyl transferase
MSAALALGTRDVHVWLAGESLADEAETAARFRASMSADERTRHERFAAESPRRLDLVARGLQRGALSHYEPGVDPAAWRFVRSATGRPSLAPPFDSTGLHFNLAHARGLVVMAVGRVPTIGIDVEALDKRVRLEIANRYFSEREAAELFELPPAEQAARFLRLWTLKEAYVKATGTGIAGGLGRMTFGFDATGAVTFERADDPRAGQWVFRELGFRGYLVALAFLDPAATAAPLVTLREFHAGAGTSSGQEQRAEP